MPEEPQDALPPSPWHIEHAIGGPIVWGSNGELVIVLGSQPKHLALAALLLRAREVEQAARDGIALIEREFGSMGPPVIQAVKERLRVALGEQK